MSTTSIDTGYDESTGELSSNTFVTRTAPEHVAFRAKLRKMLSGNASVKNAIRGELVESIQASPIPRIYITQTLSLCSQNSGRGGLDDGIDVLSQLGNLIIKYSINYLISDVMQQSELSGGRASYKPNDDYWFIMLRSVARCSVGSDLRYQFISACKGATQTGIREGVVEALGDLGTEDAHKLLQEIASEDEDTFIRSLAADILEGIEN